MVMTCAAGTPHSTDFFCLSVIAPKVVEYAFTSDRTDAAALDSTQVPRLCGFAKMKRQGTGILVYFCRPEINFMSMAPPGGPRKFPTVPSGFVCLSSRSSPSGNSNPFPRSSYLCNALKLTKSAAPGDGG